MSAHKNSDYLSFYLICISVVIILLLSAINIGAFYSSKKQVLGVQNESISETKAGFWEPFLRDNPEYTIGWIEIGRFDKVKEIDPNFFIRELP